jgi:preprotein translocase subunit SecD
MTDFQLLLKESNIHNIRESAVRQTMDTIRRRLSEFGIAKPRLRLHDEINQENQDQIIVEFPSVDDPERLKSLIGNTAQLKLCLVKKEGGGPFSSIEAAYEANSGALDEYQILSYIGDSGRGAPAEYMVVRKDPVITGNDFNKVRPSTDSNGRPAVSFFLKAEGANLFSRATADHIGENLAIILDDQVYNYPTIQGQISDEGIITGNFTRQAANDLALLLSTGALPASVQVLQESYVPPVDD